MTQNRDLRLDTLIHDLKINKYDLSLVDDLESTAQRLKVRLLFFLTEWFLDREQGIPYLQDILQKAPDLQKVENIIKTVILTTPRVIQLNSFSLDYDNLTRKLIVEFNALTDDGDLTFSGVLP